MRTRLASAIFLVAAIQTTLLQVSFGEQSNRTVNTMESATIGYEAPTQQTWNAQELMRELRQSGFNEKLGLVCWEKLEATDYAEVFDDYGYACLCHLAFCEPGGFDKETPEEQARHYAWNLQREMQTVLVNRLTVGAVQFMETMLLGGAFALESLLGMIGNLLVIVTVTKYMGKATVTNVYITSISLADFLVCSVCMPVVAYDRYFGVWVAGRALCQFVFFLYFFSFICSTLSLLAMSIERYIVICHPMKAAQVSSAKRARYTVLAIWIVAAGLATPIIPWMSVHRMRCEMDWADTELWKTYMYYTTVAFIVPMLVMTFAYSKICIALWKSIKTNRAMKAGNDGKQKGQNEDTTGRVQVIRTMIIVTVVFFICWAPYWLMCLLSSGRYIQNTFRMSGWNVRILRTSMFAVSAFASVINPLLYGFTSAAFRKGFRRCVRCCAGVSAKDYGASTTSSNAQTVSSIVSKGNPSVTT